MDRTRGTAFSRENLGRPSSSGAGEPLRTAAAAVSIRLALAFVTLITSLTIGVRSRELILRDPQHIEVFTGFLRHLLQPWANWDGVWFIRIAAGGYRAHEYSPAFFPLYPTVVRLLTAVFGGSYVIAGIVASLACYAGAMVVLYLLVRDAFGARPAMWSVAFISIFPTAFFFQAVYSESLFLLLALLCFRWASRGRWWLAGAAGLLAALTRSTGLMLVVPLALMWWEQWRGVPLRLPGGPRLAASNHQGVRPSLPSFLAIGLVPAGLGVYMSYLWIAFGNPMAFSDAQSNWGRSFAFPLTAFFDGTVAAVRGLGWLVSNGLTAVLNGTAAAAGGLEANVAANPIEFVAMVAAIVFLVACWRRLPVAFTAYAFVTMIFPLLFPDAARPFSSMPRFLLTIFPFFVALAVSLEGRRVAKWVVVGIFVVLLIPSTVFFASFM